MNSNKITEKVKSDYNQIANSFSSSRFAKWDEFDFFLNYYSKNSDVLDLGCGNGRLLDFLKKIGFKSYVGVDQSVRLLKIAKKKFPTYMFVEQDFVALNLNNKFDAVFMIASFHHLPPAEQLNTLINLKKSMKIGSYLFMTNWNLHQPRYLYFLLRSLLFPIYGIRGVLVPWQNTLNRYYFSFTRKRLEKLLSNAGFSIIYNDYYGGSFFSAKNIVTVARL